MGGQNMCDVDLVLKRLVTLHFDNLLQEGYHDVMHFLGTSKLEWACLLTDIQRAVRKYYNPSFMITFDCASPFLATANGQVYTSNETPDRGKWTYRMLPSVDELKYATDTRTFQNATVQDGIFPKFENSPLTDGLLVNEVCIYNKGDRNKIGTPKVLAGEVELDKNDEPVLDKTGSEDKKAKDYNPNYGQPIVRKRDSTSWDSFSYAIQMGHNVWSHINAVQEANRQYDNGVVPNMLVQEKHDRVFFRDVVDRIFSCTNKEEAIKLIDNHSTFWTEIPGTRGAIGKKTVNNQTYFGELFE
jgi:hypothetical protein